MATPLDAIPSFGPIFAGLFIFVFIYGMLLKTQIFGENKESLYGAIAILAAAFTLFYKPAAVFIVLFAPWFVVTAIMCLLIMAGIMMFGVSSDSVMAGFKDGWYWAILIPLILFSIFAFDKAFDVAEDEAAQLGIEEQGNDSVRDILFHPNILGLIVTLLTAGFAVLFLSMVPKG